MRLVGTGLLMVLITFALGCSSGGSDGSAAMSDTTPDAVVGVVLTEAPSDDVEQVIATFTRIEFVGPGGYLSGLSPQQVYEVDPLECPNCGTTMRIIALIEDADVVEHILKHLKFWDPPDTRSPARSAGLHRPSPPSIRVGTTMPMTQSAS